MNVGRPALSSAGSVGRQSSATYLSITPEESPVVPTRPGTNRTLTLSNRSVANRG